MASQPPRKALLERIRQLEQDIAKCKWDCRTVQRQLDYNQKILDSLRESEAKFKTLFENASDYIVYIDAEGTIIETNDAVEQLTGFKREEVLGRNFAEIGFTRPELAEKAMKLVRDVFAGRPTQITEYENLRKDGTPVYIEANPRLVKKGGKPIGILAVIRDITDRKRAEEELRRHRDHLEEIVAERTANLEEANTALRVLLKRREEDRIELEETVLSNVKETVIPFLKKTKQCRLDDEATAFLRIAESNLNDIVTPFMRGICNRYSNLTPTEVQIVNFVLQGKRTKEIAESLHVSSRTVEFHRNNIRKKLGIDGKKVNLRTHLLSLQ